LIWEKIKNLLPRLIRATIDTWILMKSMTSHSRKMRLQRFETWMKKKKRLKMKFLEIILKITCMKITSQFLSLIDMKKMGSMMKSTANLIQSKDDRQIEQTHYEQGDLIELEDYLMLIMMTLRVIMELISEEKD